MKRESRRITRQLRKMELQSNNSEEVYLICLLTTKKIESPSLKVGEELNAAVLKLIL